MKNEEEKAGIRLLFALCFRFIHPGDMVPIIDKHLDAVPAVLSGSVDASASPIPIPDSPSLRMFFRCPLDAAPVIYRSFRETLSSVFSRRSAILWIFSAM